MSLRNCAMFAAIRNIRRQKNIKSLSLQIGENNCSPLITSITYGASPSPKCQTWASRPLPAWLRCRVIAEREVLLNHWQSTDSLDERYFAVLPTTAIVGRADPPWTNKDN